MTKKIRLPLAILLTLMFLNLLAISNKMSAEPTAQPTVKIVSDYDAQTIVVGIEPREIVLTARTNDQGFQITWKCEGPGELAGDKTNPRIFYRPPERIDLAQTRVTITLTVIDDQKRTATDKISFTLVKPEPTLTPTPTPLPAPTSTPTPLPTPPPMPTFTPPPILLLPVAAGTYPISEYLRRYLRFLKTDALTIPQFFAIQTGEVTIGEFRRYANTLADDRRKKLGTRWAQDKNGVPYPDERPVENVTWQEASDYANWLSRETGWPLQLPTVLQWAAACVKYAETQPVLAATTLQPLTKLRGQIDHLLGNLREWSADACEPGKYRLLGENYLTDQTDPDVIGQGYCLDRNARWMGVGFRLVRVER